MSKIRGQGPRSARTVAGMNGASANNARTCASTPSNAVPTDGRWYRGGDEAANALATVFLEIPSCLAITACGTLSP